MHRYKNKTLNYCFTTSNGTWFEVTRNVELEKFLIRVRRLYNYIVPFSMNSDLNMKIASPTRYDVNILQQRRFFLIQVEPVPG